MGKALLEALALIAAAPIAAALVCALAERTAVSYGGLVRSDAPAGPVRQVAAAALIALAAAWVAVAAWGPGWRAELAFALALAFLFSGLVDLKTRLLPHIPTVLAAITGVALAWHDHGWVGVGLAAAAAAAAGGMLWGLAAGWRMFAHREAMGLGDILLAGAGGALLGPEAIWLALAAGAAGTAAVTLVLRRRSGAARHSEEIPFGPGLLTAIWLAWAMSAMTF